MNSITINSFERDEDGKPALYHCLVSGRPKSLTRKQLLSAIELTLPEGPPAKQPLDTLPVRNGG